jgi:hypothetical protein
MTKQATEEAVLFLGKFYDHPNKPGPAVEINAAPGGGGYVKMELSAGVALRCPAPGPARDDRRGGCMETLYKWRVQEKDKRGRLRWRLVRSPMTEDTARFWAANNNRIIERVDTTVALQGTARPAAGSGKAAAADC